MGAEKTKQWQKIPWMDWEMRNDTPDDPSVK
jgi:hypothetical protein